PPPPPPPPTNTAPDNPVVYLATQDNVNVANLYMADADNPGTTVQLNPALPAGASISVFAASPDESQVVYIADQDTLNKFEIYRVDLDDPGVSTRLNPASTPANSDVQEFAFSPDSSQLAYTSDQDTVGARELYLVDLANPGVPAKLNAPLVPGGIVGIGSIFSPDGTQLAYAADQDVDGIFEMYLVTVAVPGVSTKLNPDFAAFTQLKQGFSFSPDGNWLLYSADQDIDEVVELYAVDLANPGASTKVNPPFAGNTDMCRGRFSPDSQKIVYCSDEDTDETLELFLVEIGAFGVSTKLNPPLVADGDIRSSDYRFSADSGSIFYRADQDVDEHRELFEVSLASPGVATRINDTMIALGDVFSFELSPDGLSVAYRADSAVDTEIELFEVALSAPGMPTRVHPELVGVATESFRYSSDGTRIVYVAEQDAADIDEIYTTDVTALGTSTKLNAPLVAGGQVGDIVIP
ncbi:MAG TPA: hypothetical protein PKK10_02370, partial [Woeseiaceae bacterium]|nr:hypothetical protein [Woeseiaceae bacterium]